MIKAVIFDLDGTLLNTSKEINLLINEALKKYGLPPITLSQTVQYIGNGAKKLVERALTEKYAHRFEEVFTYFSHIYANCKNDNTTLYEGEAEFLTALKDVKIKTAIVTNKPQAACEEVCKKHLSKFDFDYIVGQSDKFPTKPNPASLLHTINVLGVKTEECLFVGDGETDVLTAKNAGVNCVAVLWGYRSKLQLLEAGAKIFANSYKELVNYVFNN